MADADEALDLELLAQQTLGDRELAGDLFRLFEAQCDRLWPILESSPDRKARSDAAHTLKGSAAAIGATRIMQLAGELETVLDASGENDAVELLPHLGDAIEAARAAIRTFDAPS